MRRFIAVFALGCTGPGDDTDTSSTDTDIDTDIFVGSSDIVINEILSQNDANLADEEGEFDDWVELHNSGSETVDLSDWGIGDGIAADEDPWRFPTGTELEPGDFLLLWTDDDDGQGDNHTNFKLSSEGETLTLLNDADEVVDEVAFPALEADESWARSSAGSWEKDASPTPEADNNL
jgi:hypothetical protein